MVQKKVIQITLTDSKKMEYIEFNNCRYIEFLAELLYIGEGLSNEYFPPAIKTCSQKQPYTINFNHGEKYYW